MKKLLLLTLLGWSLSALGQSTPGFVFGQVPTAAQWNSYFAAKQDYSATLSSLASAGGTFASPGSIGSTTPGSGLFTTGGFSGRLTASGGLARVTHSITSSGYTPTSGDTHLIVNFAGTVTLNLGAASSNTGKELSVRTIANQTVVSGASNVVPCIGGSAGTAILAATAGKWAFLVSDGSNWLIQMCN